MFKKDGQCVKKYFQLLGCVVKDKVTGFEGVGESVTFDLYGCIQLLVRPNKLDDKGKIQDATWFDVNRIKVLNQTPVMDVPNFDHPVKDEETKKVVTDNYPQGPADKPSIR